MQDWIGNAVGKMHTNKITQIMIAEKIGWSNDYVSMILRGVKSPKGAKEKIETAIDEIIASKG